MKEKNCNKTSLLFQPPFTVVKPIKHLSNSLYKTGPPHRDHHQKAINTHKHTLLHSHQQETREPNHPRDFTAAALPIDTRSVLNEVLRESLRKRDEEHERRTKSVCRKGKIGFFRVGFYLG